MSPVGDEIKTEAIPESEAEEAEVPTEVVEDPF